MWHGPTMNMALHSGEDKPSLIQAQALAPREAFPSTIHLRASECERVLYRPGQCRRPGSVGVPVTSTSANFSDLAPTLLLQVLLVA